MTGPRTKTVTSEELAALIDVSYKRINTWATRGYLKEEPRFKGTGHRRTFRASEVRIAQVMAELVKAGVIPSVASKAARGAMVEVDSRGPLFMCELTKGVAVTGRLKP